jgi:polysaccharide deacetylase family protein (PEP-CTERM system associated)
MVARERAASSTHSGIQSSMISVPGDAVEHLFSVDVEEHFQVVALQRWAPRATWDSHPSRVTRNVDQLLDLMARHGSVGTFFTLGWVASKQPDLVRRIAAAGHEIASHGWWHRQVTRLSPAEFREDVRSSRAILEDLSGQRVLGFRAPSFSIVPGYEWAFDVLLEEGYRYDSSLFPIRRPDYGWPGAPPEPHSIRRPAGTLLEIPMATTVIAGVRVPAAGGGYFRQLPYRLAARALTEHAARGLPAMFYIHPWEVDPDQPRFPVDLVTRLRHYGGLGRTMPRLERLFSQFRFTSVARQFGALPGLRAEVTPGSQPA